MDGNNYILRMVFLVLLHLMNLTHLIDVIADAVHITLVAVVIRVWAKHPVCKHNKTEKCIILMYEEEQRSLIGWPLEHDHIACFPV